MKNTIRSLMALACCSLAWACAGSKAESNKETINEMTTESQSTTVARAGDVDVEIKTTAGDITVRLFGDTPRHRDNFVKLVDEGFYNGTLFHRVINEFMVQAGDPESKDAPKGKMLGGGDPGYTLEAEIDYPHHFHRRGALAAARTGDNVNPERRSSGSQFYIVTGKTYNDSTLKQMEQQLQMMQKQGIFNDLARENADTIKQMRLKGDREGLQKLQEELIAITEKKAAENPATLAPEVRQAYKSEGGTPHLDGQYTVFGQVIKGMDVVDKIQTVETDRNDRPVDDIKILSMKILK